MIDLTINPYRHVKLECKWKHYASIHSLPKDTALFFYQCPVCEEPLLEQIEMIEIP